MRNTIVIIVAPVLDRPGTFTTTLSGAELCQSTEPLLATARELIRRGAPPDTMLAMCHQGSDVDALRGRLGALARFTVEDGHDGVPRLRRGKASLYVGVSSPMRFDTENASPPPNDKKSILGGAS